MRPWALVAPVLVLLIALPLMRPLRRPDPRTVSDDELARLATIQALVERNSLAIEQTDFALTSQARWRQGHLYAQQPPMLAAMLSPAYRVLSWRGLTFARDPNRVAYILTLLGVTLPVAAAAGLIYRMGRLFELRRPWRTLLALAVVLASGLISYATVLNAHAPAAALILGAAGCFVHVTLTNRRLHSSIWLLAAGTCAALASAIDPPAILFLALFPLVILSLSWPWPHRLGGFAVYAAGLVLPLAIHFQLVRMAHPADSGWKQEAVAYLVPSQWATPAYSDIGFAAGDEDLEGLSLWGRGVRQLMRFAVALGGPHGAVSHFPILLLGILGVTMVMHRHWPGTTKMLASVSVACALGIVIFCATGGEPMFAARWHVVFLPLLIFWTGVWLRRRHHPAMWAVAALLFMFSLAVSLLGATGPMLRGGFGGLAEGRFSVVDAARNLVRPPTPLPTPSPWYTWSGVGPASARPTANAAAEPQAAASHELIDPELPGDSSN